MNSRAFLTAMLLGSLIAATRLVAQVPAPQPERLAAADPAICAATAQARSRAAGNFPMVGRSAGAAVAGQAMGAAIDGATSASAAQPSGCSG